MRGKGTKRTRPVGDALREIAFPNSEPPTKLRVWESKAETEPEEGLQSSQSTSSGLLQSSQSSLEQSPVRGPVWADTEGIIQVKEDPYAEEWSTPGPTLSDAKEEDEEEEEENVKEEVGDTVEPACKTSGFSRGLQGSLQEAKEEPQSVSQGVKEEQAGEFPRVTWPKMVKPSMQGVRKQDETADTILSRIRSGELENIAERMSQHIGILDEDWWRMRPTIAVSTFMRRYRAPLPTHFFERRKSCGRHACTLVTPSFFGRRFSGLWQGSREQAEEAACEVFMSDKKVNEARLRLPPAMQKIRDRASLNKVQKEQLREAGHKPASVQWDMWRSIFSGFRALGCRTAEWDGNTSEF